MSDPFLKVTASPASHLVHVGEEVEFSIEALPGTEVHVEFSIDGETVLRSFDITTPALKDIPWKGSFALPHPGFLRCTATAPGLGPVYCGVGVDPDQLKPMIPEPADFDLFWKTAFDKARKIPVDLKQKKVGEWKDFSLYLLDCANVDSQRAYAYLALPDKVEKPLPLVVNFCGGDSYTCQEIFEEYVEKVQSQMGFTAAVLQFHLPPYEPCVLRSEHEQVQQDYMKSIGLRRYVYKGLDDPEQYYAYSGIIGCVRLLEAVAAFPEIDRSRIGYHGSSHGGAFGFYLGCFFPEFKALFCGVPDYGDVGSFKGGRSKPVCSSPEAREKWEALLYFDAAFCARRIDSDCLVSAGFIDRSCSPTSVYVIYNSLRCPKMIYNKIHHGHSDPDAPPDFVDFTWLWLARRLM
jgi:cephalosporin-C deacetylase-like acetyl esterase